MRTYSVCTRTHDVHPENMTNQTSLFFVSHASVLIRFGDEYLLTDPWYLSPAFASWSPCPPATLNPSVLQALTHSDKFTIAISHPHPDHFDAAFLKGINPHCKIVICKFRHQDMKHMLKDLGLNNIHETDDEALTLGSFKINSFLSHLTEYDSALSIETPDAFIFHGNDFWRLDEPAKKRLLNIKPNKPSLFMGQGGSADGYPLTYISIPEAERLKRYQHKNRMMATGVSELATELGFDKALPYACLTRIQAGDTDYSKHFHPPTKTYCEQHFGLKNLIDLQPGDVYIPAEQRVISILSTLNIDPKHFKVVAPKSNFSEMFSEEWTHAEQIHLQEFTRSWQNFAQTKIITDHNFHKIHFALSIRDQYDVEIHHQELSSVEKQNRFATMIYQLDIPTAKALLHKIIPFEYLDTGYLAKVDRQPIDNFNQTFYNTTCEFGYFYMMN